MGRKKKKETKNDFPIGRTCVGKNNDTDKQKVILGLYSPGGIVTNPSEAVRQVCQYLDWTWLSSGDSVFIKLACNSGKRHPAVTSANAVRGLCLELLDRGAGSVSAGDQAGVEYVRLAKGEKKAGSTRNLMKENELLNAIEDSGAKPHFFEEYGFDDGYFKATIPFTDSKWPVRPYLARIIKEVDHIIGLPRLSSHVLAGYTHGHKNAVGWLREDSRHLMHFDAGSLHEKYTEVNYCNEIRDRYRMTITLAEKILLDAGPDIGTVADLKPWIIIASANLAYHDTLSVAVHAHIDNETPQNPSLEFIYDDNAIKYNRNFLNTNADSTGIPWESEGSSAYTALKTHQYQKGISEDLALTHAYRILGGMPDSIQIKLLGEEPNSLLRSFLESYNKGIFALK
ncbi:MAG: DUF362 domain-containing protein [Candidatus Aminicenantes bacterium]|nr:MAG: DUF362 domain-containing protein [Candidatus Aminicenantes bacterium]